MPDTPAIDQGQTQSPPRRRRLCWGIGLSVLLLAVVTPLAVVWWYTRPAQLIPIVEEALYEATGCEATIEHAMVNRKGELTLKGVTLRVPGAAGEFGTLMTAQRIEMVGPARGLIDGSYRPERIDMVGPVLHLTEQVETGVFNYELLAPPVGEDEVPIPQVSIKGGLIRFDQLAEDGIVELGVMGVDGMLKADDQTPKAYRFEISETDAPAGVEHIRFTGGFNLSEPSMTLHAEHFRFADEQRYFVPGEFRDWWAKLAPTGEVPEIELSLKPNVTGLLDLHEVQFSFRDVGLNLDLLDLTDPEQRDVALLLRAIKSRLTSLNGEVRIGGGRFSLEGGGRVEQHGIGLSAIDYTLSAEGSLEEDGDYKVQIDTAPFTLSERYQNGLAFSPLTGEGYRRFKPSGRFRLSSTIESAGGDQAAQWAIDLGILNGKMTHEMFPMPLKNVAGNVRIAPDRVQIGPLTADTISGASIRLDGYAQPASAVAEVKLDIAIDNLPIDAALSRALEPDARENIARFFDQQAYDRLLNRGLVVKGDAAAASGPRFDLGGTCNVIVSVHRPFGEGRDYSVVPVIDATGLSLVMTDFPYPVTAVGGSVTLGRDDVTITQLELTSPTGGGMTLNGNARKGEDGAYRPQVTIEDATLPIDPLLLSALGEEAEKLLTDLGLSGVLSLKGSILQRVGEDEPGYQMSVGVQEGRAKPYGGSVEMVEVTGSFDLNDKGLTGMDLTGRRGKTAVGVAGRVDWSQREVGTSADLTFTTKNLEWAPELVEVLPKDSELRGELTALYETYEPAGVLDAVLNWKPKAGDDEPDDFVATLTPKTLAFNLLGGRLSFENMSGTTTVYSDLMQLDELTGDFTDPDGAKGRLKASGDITYDDAPRIGLVFTGKSSALGQTAKLLMPDAAVSVAQTIRYDGALSVKSAELGMINVGTPKQATTFQGDFDLTDIDLVVGGVPIGGLHGRLKVGVDDPSEEGLPLMAFAIATESMDVLGRRVERFRITADNTANRNVLRTNRGTGSLYGGTVVLESSMDFTTDGNVRLSASIHDVELEHMLKPDKPWDLQANRGVVDRKLESGLVSGSLLLDSSYDPDGPRYGRGAIRMRDANVLNGMPLGLLLVQTVNLTYPDLRGFDRGAAAFDITGNKVVFNDLWMETRGTQLSVIGQPLFKQGLRISGSGVMALPEAELDLRFHTEVTGTTARIPFGEVFRTLRNELVGIQVTGTLKSPEVSYKVLRDTRDAWGQLTAPVKQGGGNAPK